MDEIEDQIAELDDNEIRELIDKGGAMFRLQHNEDYKLIDVICKRHAEAALHALKNTKADNIVGIIELQTIAKLYGDVLGNIFNSIKQQGEVAFETAKARDILSEGTP